jgi:hypothetical protein
MQQSRVFLDTGKRNAANMRNKIATEAGEGKAAEYNGLTLYLRLTDT